MRVGVKPHLCLLIGGMVADVAVQREGAALPLAVFSHVTLEKVTAVHLKATDVTPEGRGGGATAVGGNKSSGSVGERTCSSILVNTVFFQYLKK